MDTQNQPTFQSLVLAAQSIIIAVRRNPVVDSVASAVALSLALQKSGKRVTLISPRPVTVEYGAVIGADDFKSETGARNLLLSWDYEEGAIEGCKYYVKDGKFYFEIRPQEGKPPFDPSKVSYSYSGVDADLVITIGTQSLDQLEKLYQDEKDFFSKTPIINIDRDRNNAQYGTVNVVDMHAASVAELIVDFIRDLELPVDADIATNLLTGLVEATDNFQKPTANARTFEAAAACLQAGARRIAKPVPVAGGRISSKVTDVRPIRPQQRTQINYQPQGIVSVMPEKRDTGRTETPAQEQPAKPSPDWLKPKIYKGSSEV